MLFPRQRTAVLEVAGHRQMHDSQYILNYPKRTKSQPWFWPSWQHPHTSLLFATQNTICYAKLTTYFGIHHWSLHVCLNIASADTVTYKG